MYDALIIPCMHMHLQGYLIVNRDIVSADIEDFEYTPKVCPCLSFHCSCCARVCLCLCTFHHKWVFVSMLSYAYPHDLASIGLALLFVFGERLTNALLFLVIPARIHRPLHHIQRRKRGCAGQSLFHTHQGWRWQKVCCGCGEERMTGIIHVVYANRLWHLLELWQGFLL